MMMPTPKKSHPPPKVVLRTTKRQRTFRLSTVIGFWLLIVGTAILVVQWLAHHVFHLPTAIFAAAFYVVGLMFVAPDDMARAGNAVVGWVARLWPFGRKGGS